jgi:hypothetical protein
VSTLTLRAIRSAAVKVHRTTILAGGLTALSLVAALACAGPGGSGRTTESQPAGEAATGEAPAVVYVDSRYHYRVEAPGQMKANPDGTARVVGPSERLEIAVVQGPRASDAAALAQADVTALPGSTKSFQLLSGPAAITLAGRKAQKLVYRYNAGTSEVTGKPLDLVGVRYYIPKDSSSVAVLNYGIVSNQYDPEGADDVARTFQWQ